MYLWIARQVLIPGSSFPRPPAIPAICTKTASFSQFCVTMETSSPPSLWLCLQPTSYPLDQVALLGCQLEVWKDQVEGGHLGTLCLTLPSQSSQTSSWRGRGREGGREGGEL